MEFLVTVILRFQQRNPLSLTPFLWMDFFYDGYVTQLDFLGKSASLFFFVELQIFVVFSVKSLGEIRD